MVQRLLSAIFWSFLVLSSFALFPIAVLLWLLTAPFDRRRWLLHRFTCFWASLYSWLNPAWPVEVRGREKIRPDETYVMVSNHLSLHDVLVLFRLFTHFKWVSKIENFRLPLVGWNMRLNRYIELIRGDHESVTKMLAECRRTLLEGSSIMMFPEGTRSPDGRLRSFKQGAFELALDTKRPILPIVVQGTADALPKRGFALRGRHRIRVTVLDEVPYESFADRSVAELTDRVRSLIADHLSRSDAGSERTAA